MLSTKVVLCFLGLCAVAVGNFPPNLIHYPNYGVFMKYQGEVDLTVRPWVHEFRMPMPQLSDFYRNVSGCNTSSEIFDCERLPFASSFADYLNSVVLRRFQQFSENIMLQLPERRPNWGDREPMSGSILPLKATPFSVNSAAAAEDFVNMDMVGELTVPTLNINPSIKPYDPNSYPSDRDLGALLKYIDVVRRGVEENAEHLHGLAGDITHSLRNLSHHNFEMATFVSASCASAVNAMRAMEGLERDLVTLSHGRVPPSLLDASDILQTYSTVESLPEFANSRFRLAKPSLQYYYQLDNVRATRQEGGVTFLLELPVIAGEIKPFYMYKTEAYPLATSQSMYATAATVLGGFQPYLLLSKDGQMYMELSEDQMRKCSGKGVLRICDQLVASLSVKVPSCHLAIYRDDVDTVVEKCHLSLLKAGLQTSMFEVDPGLYVINKADVLLNDCLKFKEDSSVVESCVQCVLQVPCHCRVRNDVLEAPPRLAPGCTDKSISLPNQPITQAYHLTNLVLLRQAGRSTGDLTGRTLLDKASVEKYAAEMSEDQVATLAGEDAKQIRLNVLNEPAELSPGSVSAGTVMSILLTLLFVGFLAFYVWRNRRLQEEINKLSRHRAVQVPLAAGDQELQEVEVEQNLVNGSH